ncbi:MAG: PIN domain-containing protein, partial [Bacteroidota bacterium]
MKVYFDTNIILDFLLARPASGLEAAQLITLAETKSIEAFAAGNTFVLAFFHMRKGGYDANDAKHTLALLCRSISCVDFGNDALDKALSTNEPVDLEDAYQIQLALQSKADV